MAKIKGWVSVQQNPNGSFTITGRVGEFSKTLKTEPHNQCVINNDRESGEWACTQSHSLTPNLNPGQFSEVFDLWMEVLGYMRELAEKPKSYWEDWVEGGDYTLPISPSKSDI